MFIDTHAHLNFKDFENDYSQVIERAFNADVKNIINVGSNLETSKKAITIAKEFNDVYAAIGLHPIHIGDPSTAPGAGEKFDEISFVKLAKNKKVVAIGETGLDYYYDKSNSDTQKEVFEKFLKIANLVNKPVILHSRDAGEDILAILTAQPIEPLGVMHCFSENWDFAKVVLDMGLYLSFTGVITFTKNQETLEVIREAPLDRIMIETDCPYMTPEPYRGKRNEPSFVIEVAKKIAEIKKIPFSKVAEVTTKNAKELFKI